MNGFDNIHIESVYTFQFPLATYKLCIFEMLQRATVVVKVIPNLQQQRRYKLQRNYIAKIISHYLEFIKYENNSLLRHFKI